MLPRERGKAEPPLSLEVGSVALRNQMPLHEGSVALDEPSWTLDRFR